MALSELAALDAAYQALHSLDPAGRRRALQWLSDALGTDAPLSSLPTDDQPTPAAAKGGVQVTATPNARSGAPGRAARQPRRRASAATGDTVPAAAGARTRAGRAGRAGRPNAGDAVKPAKGTGQGARPYRRMPAAEEVMAAYRRVGSVSGLAEHFDVPVHTVQGWARQLRRQGYTIGQTR
jgi:hypothetical protein